MYFSYLLYPLLYFPGLFLDLSWLSRPASRLSKLRCGWRIAQTWTGNLSSGPQRWPNSKCPEVIIFHQDFITLMLVLGLGQLLTTMVKPILLLTDSFHIMQVLPMSTRAEKFIPSDFLICLESNLFWFLRCSTWLNPHSCLSKASLWASYSATSTAGSSLLLKFNGFDKLPV